MTEKSKLSALDWIKAAFRALTTKGPQGIKAEALARTLKVSKGSFYWHFKDVAALKAAMLNHWEQQATRQIIAQIDQETTDPLDRLRDLIEIASSNIAEEYGGDGAEAALRNWAMFDAQAHECVSRVDAQRLNYVESLFSQITQTRDNARINSQILYATLIGASQLEPADLKLCLTHALQMLLSKPAL